MLKRIKKTVEMDYKLDNQALDQQNSNQQNMKKFLEKKNEHVYDILFKKLNYDDEQLGFKEMMEFNRNKGKPSNNSQILSNSFSESQTLQKNSNNLSNILHEEEKSIANEVRTSQSKAVQNYAYLSKELHKQHEQEYKKAVTNENVPCKGCLRRDNLKRENERQLQIRQSNHNIQSLIKAKSIYDSSQNRYRDKDMGQELANHWILRRNGQLVVGKEQVGSSLTFSQNQIKLNNYQKRQVVKQSRAFYQLTQIILRIYNLNLDVQQVKQYEVFTKKPFHLIGSYKFFECLKSNQLDLVEAMLTDKSNKAQYYVYTKDFKLRTPLQIALIYNIEQYVKKFIQLHSDLEHLDLDKRTPLYYALKASNYEAVKALLLAGASPWTPLVQTKYTYNTLSEDPQILKLLRIVRKFDLLKKLSNHQRKKSLWATCIKLIEADSNINIFTYICNQAEVEEEKEIQARAYKQQQNLKSKQVSKKQ
eukprot:TRINITY_DN6365_c0_g1_i6.p1 TRINITY_DN6365_c0_g1~~TRINITY_DN6365_c0_g1_i6.p1  ORF type:complete len:476 (-),score=64.29 TRINITY_DN6365_c0_g1_i6:9-1436(-)